jgi:hypothetical protein
METIRIRDPGWNNSDPESGMEKSRIRDKHSGSATLLYKTIRYLSIADFYLFTKAHVKVLFTGKPVVQNLKVPCLIGSRYTERQDSDK